jgi:hypothetical protein
MAKDPVNKYTSKTTHDGIELTWNAEKEGGISAKDAAAFYVESVEALQKFRQGDPRTQPGLRAMVKSVTKWFWICVGLVVLWATYHAGKGDLMSQPDGWSSERSYDQSD